MTVPTTSRHDDPAIEVEQLTFRFKPDVPDVLRAVNLQLGPGSRCILVGANGAGASSCIERCE